jgi:hypothetical protein
MPDFIVDRELLEQNSTMDILRILKSEREDYTPEAIEIFEDILRQRGVALEHVNSHISTPGPPPPGPMSTYRSTAVKNPADALRVLNNVLDMMFTKKIDHQAATAAANVVMTMLRAMEQEYMQDSGD